ncbi:MAG TPA: type II secretion system protein [Thermoanaerobaculia bacterium]|jgi:prepilin-type N-terminal cleavage/methylation domain-containing protein
MSLSRLPSRAGRANGFTLLEALIGLAILGVALLLGMALVIQLPRDVRRLDAERQAMRAMEATLEGMRSGLVSVHTPGLGGFITLPDTAATRKLNLGIDVVAITTRPGLCQVTLTAHYWVLNSEHQKQLQALIRSSGC